MSQYKDYNADWSTGLDSRQEQVFISMPPRPDRLLGPPRAEVKNGCRYTSSVPQTCLWRGA
jgi:hypothetical protein